MFFKGHFLRRAYKEIVIDVHEPSAANRRSYGPGPVAVPPASTGSSEVIHVVRPQFVGRIPMHHRVR
jgi:hypothetical protein